MTTNNKKDIKIQSALTNKDDWMYEGKKTKQFLARYEVWAKRNEISEEKDKCEQFALMTSPKLWERVTTLPGYKSGSWSSFKKDLRETFVDDDFDVFLLSDLYELVHRTKKKGAPSTYADIMKFHLKFTKVSSYLVDRHSMSAQDETRQFLRALNPHN